MEIDNDGELVNIQHNVPLHEVSFLDILSQEKLNEILNVGDNFSSFVQTLRKLVAYKVASDLNIEVVETEDYVLPIPLREKVEQLEKIQMEQDELLMQLLLGGNA